MPALGPSAIAGACAGLVSSIVTCPLDVVKTKLQAQSSKRPSAVETSGATRTASAVAARPALGPSHVLGAVDGQGDRVYRGLLGTLRTIYKYDGIRGFYRGLGPTIFGYLPTWAIYFTVYDGCKEFLANNAGKGEEDFVNHIVSALAAGGASTVCTSPLWVVKTRFMLQSAKPRDPAQPPPYKHTLDAFVRIMQTEGPRGFYRGLLPSLVGVSHVAVQFPLYETFKSWAREASGISTDVGGHGPADLPPRVILACSSSAKMIASVLTYPHEVVRTRLQMHPRTKASVSSNVATAASTSSQGRYIRTTASASADTRQGYATFARSSATLPFDTRRHSSLTPTTATTTTTTTPSRPVPYPPVSSYPPLQSRLQSSTSSRGSSAVRPPTPPPPPPPPQQQQQKYTSLFRTVRTIFREEGLRGFYNGMGVNLIRTVPSSALTILTYELMMQQLTQPGGGFGVRDAGGGGDDGGEGVHVER